MSDQAEAVAESNDTGEAPPVPPVPGGAPGLTEQGKKGGPLRDQTMFIFNIPNDKIFSYEEDLKEIFSPYGKINIIKQMGFQANGPNSDVTLSAYIQFANADAALKALEERGRNFGGNELDLSILKSDPNSVVADGLPVTMRTECIRNLLQACGAIKDVVKIAGRRKQLAQAYIEFEEEEGAKKALTLNGKLLINDVRLVFSKRVVISNLVMGHKWPAPPAPGDVRHPLKRPGAGSKRGRLAKAAAPMPVLQQPFYRAPRGGRGQRGAPRGGPPPFRTHFGFPLPPGSQLNDRSMNKRKKPNDWI